MKQLIALFSVVVGSAIVAVCAAEETFTPEQIAAESKRANEFFDRCFDEFAANHPQRASELGIKTNYDKWDDISDGQTTADLALAMQQLSTLKRGFKLDALDPQSRLSYELFERQVQRDAEGFRFRFDNYPVNQQFGPHSGIPTFLINVHRIDNIQDAEAYIARINGVQKLFDQLIVNLRTRDEKGVIPPRFVFPLVLDACRKVIQGEPFGASGSERRKECAARRFLEEGRRSERSERGRTRTPGRGSKESADRFIQARLREADRLSGRAGETRY